MSIEMAGRRARAIRDRVKTVYIVSALLVFAVVAIVILVVSGRTGSIELSVGDQTLKIELPNGELGYNEMLKQLMRGETEEEKEVRKTALVILAANYDVYFFGSQELIDRIGNEEGTRYAEDIIELVEQKRGPFKGSSIYNLNKSDAIVNYIRKGKYDNPTIVALRQEILKGGLPNVEPKDRHVTVMHEKLIPIGQAGVCEQSEFQNHKVRLFHPDIGKTIRVMGDFLLREHVPCTERPNDWVQIGDDDFETLGRIAKAVAKAEPTNYREEPLKPPRAEGQSSDASDSE